MKDHYYDGIDDVKLPTKKRSKKNGKNSKKKKYKKLRILIIVEIIILILLLIALFIKSKFDKIERYELNKNNLNITDLGLKDFYNICVFGVDSRDGELDKNVRSDTMMLVSINTKTKDIKLTSFYRDTYAHIEGHDFTKLGHAYSYGGPELAISTLNDNYDLDISNFVTVNFTAVANAIDLLGGVEINVEQREIDSVNKYGREVAKVNNDLNGYVNITYAGKQTLNGYQAVGYSRIRKIDSDLNRTSRQRTVVNAMFSKVKASDFSTINKMIDELSPQILTSLSNAELLSILKDIATYNISDSEGFPYNTAFKSINGASFVVPSDLNNDIIKLHSTVFGLDNYELTTDAKNYCDHITASIY